MYTYFDVDRDREELALELAEWPAPAEDCYGAGWISESFRPLVERKTDISVFTALLDPAKTDA